MVIAKRIQHSFKLDAYRLNYNAGQSIFPPGTSLPTSASSSSSGLCASIKKPDFGISSLSLGTLTHHTLPEKIRLAARHGFDGIEIFIPDFEDFVRQCGFGMHSQIVSEHVLAPSFEEGCASAISALCRKHSLKIHCLQPLRDFENIGDNVVLLNNALTKADRYLRIMKHLNTDLLLVCSNNLAPLSPLSLPGASYTKYRDAQVRALRELGLRASKLDLRVGYEPLAWGTVINTWEQVWDVVKHVNMENVGVILDTFNSLANFYADPSKAYGVKDGMTIDKLYQYLGNIFETIPPNKLFLLQVADAERVAEHNTFQTSRNAPAKMKWSRTSRLFPCEENRGAYLPVQEYMRTIMDLGYTGPWSLEVFSSCLEDDKEEAPAILAQRGIESLEKLYSRIAYDV